MKRLERFWFLVVVAWLFQKEEINEQELAVIRDHIREGMKCLGVKCSFE